MLSRSVNSILPSWVSSSPALANVLPLTPGDCVNTRFRENGFDADDRLYPATQEMVLGSSIGALTGGVDPVDTVSGAVLSTKEKQRKTEGADGYSP